MKIINFIIWGIISILFAIGIFLITASVSAEPLSVCFTPGQPCTTEIVTALKDAKKSIYVQAYSFTSLPIAQALIEASQRGVLVYIIGDKREPTERNGMEPILLGAHLPIWIDYKVRIAHNKVMIIDESTVITGSFNFTTAAQYNNAENLLIIQSSELAKQYLANWKQRQSVSKKV